MGSFDGGDAGNGVRYPKGPRTQIIGLKGPNTIKIIVFGVETLVME